MHKTNSQRLCYSDIKAPSSTISIAQCYIFRKMNAFDSPKAYYLQQSIIPNSKQANI
ncbi:hypothetical protein Syun_011673 [Stephania yunnanensis]|uniref:Uncharacterized protein n=1 Tax=Stephania yunnanensis TaxID=152371 RepID=A0AAP0JY00_9MAGN